jgi:Terminase large subunit, T4likevirus-type, N-terminal/Terminase RNaseH-like domain
MAVAAPKTKKPKENFKIKPVKERFYLKNPRLKRVGVKEQFSQEQVDEWSRCAIDPVYFIKTYCKIVHVDRGIITFEMYDFQEEIIETYFTERKVIVKLPRQMGKTTTTAAFFIWYILFQSHKVCAILANKAPMAQEILNRIQLMYENIPSYMQQGIVEWNKRSITLENGSRILAAATSSSAIRGYSLSMVFMDEFAHVPNNIAEEFFTSTFPTLSSGKETKILMASTPKGLNHYCQFWADAKSGKNDFVPVEYAWNKVPDRDLAWFEEQRRTLGEQKFRQEVLCEFLGSSDTLISGATLALMVLNKKNPIINDGGWNVYEHPQQDHAYVICVDPARGLDQDASAFWVIDISQIPYRGVAEYHSASIAPMVFPNMIYNAAIKYNRAFVLIEINDNGQQIVDMLHYDLEYENIFKLESSQKTGAKVAGGYKKGVRLGLRMTESVKRIGCLNLKTLLEQNKLLIHDFETISELSTFTQQLQTYKAEEGKHDDLAMCLVMFAWLVTQKYFREAQGSSLNIAKALETEQTAMVDDDIVPFGIIDTGLEDPFTVEDGDLWVQSRGMDPQEMMNFMARYARSLRGL